MTHGTCSLLTRTSRPAAGRFSAASDSCSHRHFPSFGGARRHDADAGLLTWAVLLGGWVLFCTFITWLGENVQWVKESKLQPYERSHDPEKVALANRTVVRNWVFVLAQVRTVAPARAPAVPITPRLARARVVAWQVSWHCSSAMPVASDTLTLRTATVCRRWCTHRC